MEKYYPLLTKLAIKLSLVCFILAIVSKLSGFVFIATARSFFGLTVVGMLIAINLSLLRLLDAKNE